MNMQLPLILFLWRPPINTVWIQSGTRVKRRLGLWSCGAACGVAQSVQKAPEAERASGVDSGQEDAGSPTSAGRE